MYMTMQRKYVIKTVNRQHNGYGKMLSDRLSDSDTVRVLKIKKMKIYKGVLYECN